MFVKLFIDIKVTEMNIGVQNVNQKVKKHYNKIPKLHNCLVDKTINGTHCFLGNIFLLFKQHLLKM